MHGDAFIGIVEPNSPYRLCLFGLLLLLLLFVRHAHAQNQIGLLVLQLQGGRHLQLKIVGGIAVQYDYRIRAVVGAAICHQKETAFRLAFLPVLLRRIKLVQDGVRCGRQNVSDPYVVVFAASALQ